MAVRALTAPPGFGKTLNMSRIALELFKEENKENIIFKIIRKIKKQPREYNNNIYSNYPILLKKKKKKFLYYDCQNNLVEAVPIKKMIDEDGDEYFIQCDEENRDYYGCFSLRLKFQDMRLKYRFKKRASFFIDEIAFIYDSMEYKDFPDCIAHFFSIHRHLTYNMIYTNSQSLSRIIKRVLCISEEFWNIYDLRKFLFWHIVTFKVTSDIKVSKESENDREIENPKYEIYTKWFLRKKVYASYYTRYLKELNNGLELYNLGSWESLKISKKDIMANFIITKQEKEELKEMIF